MDSGSWKATIQMKFQTKCQTFGEGSPVDNLQIKYRLLDTLAKLQMRLKFRVLQGKIGKRWDPPMDLHFSAYIDGY